MLLSEIRKNNINRYDLQEFGIFVKFHDQQNNFFEDNSQTA